LLSSGVNFAKQTSRGFDFDMAYRHELSDGSRINLRGIVTLTLERNDFTDPVFPNVAFHQLDNLGDPALRGDFTLGYGKGPWDLQWTIQWIGRQTITSWEATHSFQGRPPSDPNFAAQVWYPNVFYHDVRFSYKINNHYRFYMGVDNLFDKLPPYGQLGTSDSAIGGSSPFSDIGRYYYAGAQLDF
jgi:outer membrane receptor protein involved in Fe transport